MNKTEANIQITRKDNRSITVSVTMPVWNKKSDHGNLIVSLPLLGIDTIAKDEDDADKAIKEALTSFCIVAERFGQGIEKELLCLGWEVIDDTTEEKLIGYTVSDGDNDALLDRLIQTGDNFVTEHLEIA